MVTSTFFNNFSNFNEQELLEDLVVESVKIYGMDMYYLPRRRGSFDEIYYEDDTSYFDTTYPFEFYLVNHSGFEGQGSFMSKFGLEIRDEVILSCARRTFEKEVTHNESAIVRPREGDLIYFPLNKKCFEIKYVDNKPFFYQLGQLQMYDMTCELYEYSSERFATGIEFLDSLQRDYSINVLDYTLTTEDGFAITTEAGDPIVLGEFETIQEEKNPVIDNKEIADEIAAEDVIDFSDDHPYQDGDY